MAGNEMHILAQVVKGELTYQQALELFLKRYANEHRPNWIAFYKHVPFMGTQSDWLLSFAINQDGFGQAKARQGLPSLSEWLQLPGRDELASVPLCEKITLPEGNFLRLVKRVETAEREWWLCALTDELNFPIGHFEELADLLQILIKITFTLPEEVLEQEMEAYQSELLAQNAELLEQQAELQELKNEYTFFFEEAPVAYIKINEAGKVLQLNRKAKAMLGDLSFKYPFNQILNRADLEAFRTHLFEVFANRKPLDWEMTLRVPGQPMRYVQVNAQAYTMPNHGEGIACIATLTDITEQKENARRIQETQQALIRSQEIYRNVVDAIPHFLFDLDLSGKCTFVNDTFERHYQLPKEAFIGKTAYDMYPPDLAEKYHQDNEWVIQNRRPLPIREEHLVPGNEEPMIVEGTKSPIFNIHGEVTGIQCIFWDATEKVLYEKRLTFQSSILAHISDAVIVTDLTGKVIYTNHAVEKVYGYTREEMMGMSVATLYLGNQEQIKDDLQQILEGKDFEGEWKGRHKNGSEIWVEVLTTLLYDEFGTVNGFIGVSRNITEEMLMREQILESEERYRNTVLTLTEGVIVQGINGEILLANESAERILGYSKAQLIGKSSSSQMWVTVRADGSPFPSEEHPASLTLRTGKPQRDVVMGLKAPIGKEMVWISINSQPIWREGKVAGAVTSFLDITLKREQERALLISNQVLKDFKSAISHSVLMTYSDLYGRITDANEYFCTISGYTYEELYGQDHKILNSGHHPKIFWAEMWERIQSGKVWRGEVCNKTKQGELYWVDTVITPVFDTNNQITGYLSIRYLITEKKEKEEALKQHNEALQKANEELDNFVYRVSHDLRAPISSALGLLDLIGLSADAAEKEMLLENQRKSLVKLDAFIKDILSYSRNARLEVACEEVNLPDLIEGILAQHRSTHSDVEIRFEWEADARLYSDSLRLTMIFNNLISNALKFQVPRKPDKFVQIVAQISEEALQVRISDNGMGIEEQHLDKIFKIFYRATDRSPGSGLGLYIVKESILKMHGDIEVQSTWGEGTTFNILVPNQFLTVTDQAGIPSVPLAE